MRQGLVFILVFFCGLMVGALVRWPAMLLAEKVPVEASSNPRATPEVIHAEQTTATQASPAKVGHGVILITGTWGAFEFWPVVVENKTSFASELLRVMQEDGDLDQGGKAGGRSGGGGVDEVELIADASMLTNAHASRVRNAEHLAAVIDDLAQRVERVHVIAHSHGGNVALHAAGLCQAPIKTVVCLSTPHVLYELRDADYRMHLLPVYLTPAGRANIQTLLTITPSTDKVASTYAGLANGLPPGKANELIAVWEEDYGPLRPARGPDPIADLLGRLPQGDHDPNLKTHHVLPQADTNLVYTAYTGGRLTIDAHNSVHSHAMGALIAPILRDGPLAKHLQAIQDYVQPASADDGWPVAETKRTVSPAGQAVAP